MKNFIPFFLAFAASLSMAWADEGSDMAFTKRAEAFCEQNGGVKTMSDAKSSDGKLCKTVECKKKNAGDYTVDQGDKNQANVESTREICLSKSEVDDLFNRRDQDGNNGSSDSKTPTPQSQETGGKPTTTSGGVTRIQECTDLAARLIPGSLCYEECSAKQMGYRLSDWAKGFGGEVNERSKKWAGGPYTYKRRPECVQCVFKNQRALGVSIDLSELPVEESGNGKGTGGDVVLGSAVKTGKKICVDTYKNNVEINGSVCPSGTSPASTGSTVIGLGGSNGGSTGTYVIGLGGNSGSGSVRDNYTDSDNSGRGRRSGNRCTSEYSERDCLGDDYYYEVSSRYGSRDDCPDCSRGSRNSNSSSAAEIFAAILPPLAQVGVAGINAVSSYNNNKLWSDATIRGYEQCRASKQDYLGHIADYRADLAASEQPALTSDQEAQLMATANCNGFGANSFAGLGPNYNNYYNAGYSPGYMNGMNGPYAPPFYSPYQQPGGYVNGGINGFNGGWNGGVNGGINGFNGGWNGGGWNGGVNGGINGFNGGWNGGGWNGGVNGGINGFNGGWNGGGWNGGVNGGINGGGWNQGGGCGWACGGPGSGTAQWGNQNNNYWGQTGGWNGGNPQADYNASMYASNQDRMLQQRGGAFQMGNGNYGNSFNAGAAGYQPANLGFGLNGGISFGI